jgi:hypothetical protein
MGMRTEMVVMDFTDYDDRLGVLLSMRGRNSGYLPRSGVMKHKLIVDLDMGTSTFKVIQVGDVNLVRRGDLVSLPKMDYGGSYIVYSNADKVLTLFSIKWISGLDAKTISSILDIINTCDMNLDDIITLARL